MDYKRIKENTTAILSLVFKNDQGELEAPQSIQYRVDCVENREQLRDWTVVTPSLAEVEIELTPEDNACVHTHRGVERHVVTVKADYNGDQQLNNECIYEVQNLRFL